MRWQSQRAGKVGRVSPTDEVKETQAETFTNLYKKLRDQRELISEFMKAFLQVRHCCLYDNFKICLPSPPFLTGKLRFREGEGRARGGPAGAAWLQSSSLRGQESYVEIEAPWFRIPETSLVILPLSQWSLILSSCRPLT